MERLYHSLSAFESHRWIEENKQPHEVHLLDTAEYDTIQEQLEKSNNALGVVAQRVKIPCLRRGSRWIWVYSVYRVKDESKRREIVPSLC